MHIGIVYWDKEVGKELYVYSYFNSSGKIAAKLPIVVSGLTRNSAFDNWVY